MNRREQLKFSYRTSKYEIQIRISYNIYRELDCWGIDYAFESRCSFSVWVE